MSISPTIRTATPDDAEAVRAIYAPYVEETAISFEREAPDAATMRERIEARLASHTWIMAERDGAVVGYAYAGPFNPRAAYRPTAEVSVYVDRAAARGGIGHALYAALLDWMRGQGFHSAIGIIALPNAASVGLHERFGFEHVGTFREVGAKFGRWHDVGWWQLILSDDTAPSDSEPSG